MSAKNYILDTNVLLSDPSSLFAFEENNVIIPLVVLEELDRHKGRPDEIGKNARTVTRSLDELRQKGSLETGVKLDIGGATGILKVVSSALRIGSLPVGLQPDKADNMIIATAHNMWAKNQTTEKFILVSKDINVRVKCDALGVPCQDYMKNRVTTDKEQIFRGVRKIETSPEVITRFYEEDGLEITPEIVGDIQLCPNEFVVLKNDSIVGGPKSAIGRVVDGKNGGVLQKLYQAHDGKGGIFGLVPKNKEQTFAIDLLMDPSIKLVTLLGPAGTGKTLVAVAAGLHQVQGIGGMQDAPYSKLIITRPIQPLGKDIGYLPGTLEEKMDPWISPLKDSLNFLFGNKNRMGKRDETMLTMHMEKKKIEVEALTYIRGRSIPNAFIIIDEAQNLSMHELKTIVTRVSEGTKIILTGDIEQIDNTHVDVYTNGLTYAVEKFKDYPIAGHVTMIKGERSELATLASKIL